METLYEAPGIDPSLYVTATSHILGKIPEASYSGCNSNPASWRS